MKFRNTVMKFRAVANRVNNKAMAVGGIVLASSLPMVSYADGDAIETAIAAAITRATTLGTTIVAGYFTIWALFLLLKAKK